MGDSETEERKLLTPEAVAEIKAKLAAHKAAIGHHRDALRELIEEIESIADDADEACNLIEDAADALSRLL